MKIINPTLGAGNGKIGSLVGWADGNAQILRINTKVRKSTRTPASTSRIRMRKAANCWRGLNNSQRSIFNDYANSNNYKSGWLLFSAGYVRALISTNYINNFWSMPPNIHVSSADPLELFTNPSANMPVVKYNLNDDNNNPYELDTNNISIYAQTAGYISQIDIYFTTRPNPIMISGLKNEKFHFGLMLDLELINNKAKVRRSVFVTSIMTFDPQVSPIYLSLLPNSESLNWSPIMPLAGMKYNAKLYLVAGNGWFQRQLIFSDTNYII